MYKIDTSTQVQEAALKTTIPVGINDNCELISVGRYTASNGSDYLGITFKDAKGKFGRILADVIVYHSAEDRWCGATEIMIAQGYGVKYEGQSKEDIQEAHLANRKKLTEQGLAD